MSASQFEKAQSNNFAMQLNVLNFAPARISRQKNLLRISVRSNKAKKLIGFLAPIELGTRTSLNQT